MEEFYKKMRKIKAKLNNMGTRFELRGNLKNLKCMENIDHFFEISKN